MMVTMMSTIYYRMNTDGNYTHYEGHTDNDADDDSSVSEDEDDAEDYYDDTDYVDSLANRDGTGSTSMSPNHIRCTHLLKSV